MFFSILFVTFIVFGSSTSNTNHTAIAQQQPPFIEDLSFDIDNVTFSHHMASVNGIQLHYVIGGQGTPLYYCMDFHNHGMNGDILCAVLAKNYTVVVLDLRGFGDSSKPVTGYDGKTTAEDIYQLTSQLGFNQILLCRT